MGRFSMRSFVFLAAFVLATTANAADLPLPTISIDQFLTWIGLLVMAVFTIASAMLSVYLTIRGTKAIRQAF
ncbi:hypothetical protein [Acinetobacter haemolyticus]|uniref:hypothetical protein n=1 Tax=Acinetobacter haemolyticus TaxID=29430 RepID=UPI0021CDCFB3|nr:hypothetical protein [Acinetobacter haemolyticus]MCU4377947.1 hypothetical protein [Acinetobacter haemolyticus]